MLLKVRLVISWPIRSEGSVMLLNVNGSHKNVSIHAGSDSVISDPKVGIKSSDFYCPLHPPPIYSYLFIGN